MPRRDVPIPVKLFACALVASDVGLLFCFIIVSWALSQRLKLFPERCALQHIPEVCKGDMQSCEAQTVEVATRHQRQQQPSEFNLDEQLVAMQAYAANRNLGGAMRTFRLIKKSGAQLNSHMYNIALQACVNSGNLQAAEDWMEEILEAKMADIDSFHILIKALLEGRAMSKAREALRTMRRSGVQPCTATFNELIGGFAREERFSESLSLLDEMHACGLPANDTTLNILAKLMNDARHIDTRLSRIQHILHKFKVADFEACPSSGSPCTIAFPRLAAVSSRAAAHDNTRSPCLHELQIAGSLPHVKAARRTLKQHGFLDKSESDAWPLDGHWETDCGLTVVIEGKIVRWSGEHASRLHFTSGDRSSCALTLYGKLTQGRLAMPDGIDANKRLLWDNGDTWTLYEGRAIGQDVLYSQTMTKASRDCFQDRVYNAHTNSVLKCLSKQGLVIPAALEGHIALFLSNNIYNLSISFASKWNPSCVVEDELPLFDTEADICQSISRRHPQLGLRHSWAQHNNDSCGQRTLVNGEEVREGCYSRHVGALSWT